MTETNFDTSWVKQGKKERVKGAAFFPQKLVGRSIKNKANM